MKIGITDPDALLYMQEKNYLKISNLFIIRLDRAEISVTSKTLFFCVFLRTLWHYLRTTAPKNLVPGQGAIWCRQSWRHKETIDVGCIAQFHHSSRDITKKRFHTKINSSQKSHCICDATLNFAISALNFEPRFWTARACIPKHSRLFFVFAGKVVFHCYGSLDR